MAKQYKANVFSNPLVLACQNGHYSTAEKLLDRGFNVDGRDSDGVTPLIWACLYGWMTIVVLLFSRGADVNMQDNGGWSALMHASKNGHSNIAKMLIDKGAEVNMLNIKGGTALCIASVNGHKEIVQILLDHHADTSIRDSNGQTALDWACSMEGRDEVIDLLLSSVPVEGSSSSRSLVSANPSVITSDNTSESPISSSPIITVTSSPCIPNQDDHATTPVIIDKDPFVTNKPQMDTNDIEQPVLLLQDPPPELSLVTLYKELETVTEPIKLGMYLGVAEHKLEIIKRNHPQDIEQQKHEVFSIVSKNSLNLRITWEKIADTLEHSMSMGNLAHNIRRQFNLQSSIIEGQQATAFMDYSKVERVSHDMVLCTNELIGNGNFSAVFKGEVNGQPCAIKLLYALASQIRTQMPISSTKDSSERFVKECEFLESFDHPNIVCHLATRAHLKTGQLVLALELMDCNLRHYFTPQPDKEPVKLELPAQTSLCHDIASALEYIHSRGVVHRDLCGEKILLSCGGATPIAKVCDFGMSKITTSDTQSASHVLSRKGFIPPEATDIESFCYTDSKFDIYSFGALMVQIVRHLPTIKDRRERECELVLIPENHPIKELIGDCLNYNRNDRPSAAHLKRRLSDPLFTQSKIYDVPLARAGLAVLSKAFGKQFSVGHTLRLGVEEKDIDYSDEESSEVD